MMKRKCPTSLNLRAGESYQLREPSIPYGVHFGGRKGDIGPKNIFFWNVTL
jgi:hypothetical protein